MVFSDLNSVLLAPTFWRQEPPSIAATAPVRLRSLEVGLCIGNAPMIENLITTCLAQTNPSLNELTVWGGYRYLPSLLPLAPSLTSITLGNIATFSVHVIREFLSQAENVSQLFLQIGCADDSAMVLTSVRAEIPVLQVLISSGIEEDVLEVSRGAAEMRVGVMRGLKLIGLQWDEDQEEGWTEFVTAFAKYGTRVVDEMYDREDEEDDDEAKRRK